MEGWPTIGEEVWIIEMRRRPDGPWVGLLRDAARYYLDERDAKTDADYYASEHASTEYRVVRFCRAATQAREGPSETRDP